MSIRIRTVHGIMVAVCAARSVPKEGDVYLDDAQHHALAAKFRADFNSEGLPLLTSAAEDVIREREESNNPNRAWWDSQYAPTPRGTAPMESWLEDTRTAIAAGLGEAYLLVVVYHRPEQYDAVMRALDECMAEPKLRLAMLNAVSAFVPFDHLERLAAHPTVESLERVERFSISAFRGTA